MEQVATLVGCSIIATLILPIINIVYLLTISNRQQEEANRSATQFRTIESLLREQNQLLTELLRKAAFLSSSSVQETLEPLTPEPQKAEIPKEKPHEAQTIQTEILSALPVEPPPEIPPVPTVVIRPVEIPKRPRHRPHRPYESAASSAVNLHKPRVEEEVRPPLPPRELSTFERAAGDILAKIWNWMVVGEEHRPAGVSMEFAVASTWLLRLGVLILVMGMGFFLKYSIDNDWIGPLGQVGLTVLVGVGLVAFGTNLLGKLFHPFGLGLIGAGFATLYLAAYAAHGFYRLIPIEAAFAWMVFITISIGVLAVRSDGLIIAILAILGGYGTPLMLSTTEVNFLGLFSYQLLLGCGVLGISYYKKWHLLDYLSFACNYSLFFMAMSRYDNKHFWEVMPFLTAFFVLFSTMVFLFNIVNRLKSNLLDALALLINAGVYFSVSYRLISNLYDYQWVATVSLGLAAFYVIHIWYCLIYRVLDRELLLCFIGLASFFLAVTMPLVLSPEWITVSWSIQALVMFWIAGKLQSKFMRMLSFVVYMIVIGRFGLVDIQKQYGSVIGEIAMMDYLVLMGKRIVLFGIPIGSLAGAFYLMRSSGDREVRVVDERNDIPEWIKESSALWLLGFSAFAMIFIFLNLEVNRTLGFFFDPLRLPALTLLWLIGCALLLFSFLILRHITILYLMCLFILTIILKIAFIDLPYWNPNQLYVYTKPYTLLEASMRLVDFGAMIGFLVAAFLLIPQTDEDSKNARYLSGILSIVMLFVFLSLEVNTFLTLFANGSQTGGISILWMLFAIGLLIGGIHNNWKPMRYVALVLSVIVVCKVFLSDLSQLDPIYRIIAFLILGILVLASSFIYLKYRSSFIVQETAARESQS